MTTIWVYPPDAPRKGRAKLNPEFKEAFVSALDSGEFSQARGAWHDDLLDAHCALGVAEIVIIRGLPRQLPRDAGRQLFACPSYGLTPDIQSRIVDWNDIEGMSFHDIAIRIKEEY